MARPKKPTQTTRKQYSEEYRTEVLALAAKVGVSAAAKQLGLHVSQIYGWRSKARLHQDRGDAERDLAVENARLKRLREELASQGKVYNRKTIAASMRRQGLRTKAEKKNVFNQAMEGSI